MTEVKKVAFSIEQNLSDEDLKKVKRNLKELREEGISASLFDADSSKSFSPKEIDEINNVHKELEDFKSNYKDFLTESVNEKWILKQEDADESGKIDTKEELVALKKYLREQNNKSDEKKLEEIRQKKAAEEKEKKDKERIEKMENGLRDKKQDYKDAVKTPVSYTVKDGIRHVAASYTMQKDGKCEWLNADSIKNGRVDLDRCSVLEIATAIKEGDLKLEEFKHRDEDQSKHVGKILKKLNSFASKNNIGANLYVDEDYCSSWEIVLLTDEQKKNDELPYGLKNGWTEDIEVGDLRLLTGRSSDVKIGSQLDEGYEHQSVKDLAEYIVDKVDADKKKYGFQ